MLSERRRREIAREFIRGKFTKGDNNFELWRNYESMKGKMARAFAPIPNVFISGSAKPFIAVAETAQEAFEIAEKETPVLRYKAGTPEFEQYGKYWVVYD